MNKKLLSKDFYHVQRYEGKKQIHIDGYAFDEGEGLQLVQMVGLFISLDELEDVEDINSYVNDRESESKQYQQTISEEEFDEYVSGAVALPMSEVTYNTPEGWYYNA